MGLGVGVAGGVEGLCPLVGDVSRMDGEERYSLMSKTGSPAAWRAVVWMLAVEQGVSERGDVGRGASVVSLGEGGEAGSSLLAAWKLSMRFWSRSAMVAGGHNGWVCGRGWGTKGNGREVLGNENEG